MKVASLFAGIGGIDLALEALGAEVVAQVDIEPFAQQVLRRRWAGVPVLGDVREVHGGDLRGADTLAGGFPCQPVSLAGKQLAQDDPRWLWPQIGRLIDEVGPRYVLLENVPGLLGGHGGMGDVLGGLAARGYDAAWGVLAAADVGAWHRRNRVWIAATNAVGRDRARLAVPPWRADAAALPTPVVRDRESLAKVRRGAGSTARGNARQQPLGVAVAERDTEPLRRQYPTPNARDHKDEGPNVDWHRVAARSKLAGAAHLLPTPQASDNRDRGGPSTPAIRRRMELGKQVNLGMTVDGSLNPDWVEWLMGYGVGWTDPEREPEPFAGWEAEPDGLPRVVAQPRLRRQRLTALGNAVVPQCAAVAFARLINRLADMEDEAA